MKQINMTRDSNGNVVFETVSVDNTENVFFTNLDPKEAHWPTLTTNQLGPAPAANSSECPVPKPISGAPPNPGAPAPGANPPYPVFYGCKLHPDEQGVIYVYAALAAPTPALADAINGQPITQQQVVIGGKPPYAISGQLFEITGPNPSSGSGSIGPGLQLSPDATDFSGVWLIGTPTVTGTYNFTFAVNDAMGKNLQQVQYSMTVADPAA